jgi:cytochrome c-type biogenesis protein CcmH/NrfG
MMKKDVLLVGAVALVIGLILGWMIGQKSGPSIPAPASSPMAGAPAPAAPMVNAQQKINELKALVANDPKNAKAWVALGNEYFDADQPMDSIDAYQKAIDLGVNDPNLLTDQGVMFRRLGWFDRAIDNFTKAIKLDPNHATSIFNLGIVYRYDLQDFTKAEEAWTKFLAISPNGPGADRVRQELEFIKSHPPVNKQ